MDDNDSIQEVERHDLKLDATIVLTYPHETLVQTLLRRHERWLGRRDDMKGVSSADAMAPSGAVPAQANLPNNVAQKSPRLGRRKCRAVAVRGLDNLTRSVVGVRPQVGASSEAVQADRPLLAFLEGL